LQVELGAEHLDFGLDLLVGPHESNDDGGDKEDAQDEQNDVERHAGPLSAARRHRRPRWRIVPRKIA
jgi:hypothetical protein